MRLPFPVCLAWLVLIGCGSASAEPATSAAELAESYLQAVLQEDWARAASLWLPADLTASRRLDIRYQGQPFKLDSASLLVLHRARCLAGEIRASVAEVVADSAEALIRFELGDGDQTVTVPYFAVLSDRGWRLAAPVTALTAGWPRRSTEFLDLRVQPRWRMTEEAIDTLDRFVETTCDRLGVSPERIEQLRTRKLGYVWCDETTVAEIVGATTRGAALLQTDAVVTAEPCHLHEVAHLLANYGLQELPLYTLPFMQEGTAVALGGRWGRAHQVMHGLGRFAINGGLLQLEELLTWQGFRGYLPDLTYAPSGVLAGFLLDRLGGKRYLRLYREMSGDLEDLERLELAGIQDRIGAATGMNWQELRTRFDRHLEQLTCGGVLTDGIDGSDPVERLDSEGLSVAITCDDRWLGFVVQAKDTPASGAVLFRSVDPQASVGPEPVPGSHLFAEQFPDRQFEGELMALVFSPEEIGLYDFRTDLLRAKFVASFCPGQQVSSNGGKDLAFRIDSKMFPEHGWRAELIEGPGGDW